MPRRDGAGQPHGRRCRQAAGDEERRTGAARAPPRIAVRRRAAGGHARDRQRVLPGGAQDAARGRRRRDSGRDLAWAHKQRQRAAVCDLVARQPRDERRSRRGRRQARRVCGHLARDPREPKPQRAQGRGTGAADPLSLGLGAGQPVPERRQPLARLDRRRCCRGVPARYRAQRRPRDRQRDDQGRGQPRDRRRVPRGARARRRVRPACAALLCQPGRPHADGQLLGGAAQSLAQRDVPHGHGQLRWPRHGAALPDGPAARHRDRVQHAQRPQAVHQPGLQRRQPRLLPADKCAARAGAAGACPAQRRRRSAAASRAADARPAE
eukprot:Unigene8985_Nuclearia_a/m.27496 Unigene8985_Nuclearia_a/g.27496  ORF Unigene8985_Nuclearia_a/g.27496 Unigene8985_Nuclearia_a/m.27496 type:complete len:324 (+) Unigene8985_Nuclearia_a:502-1473(+)